MSFPEDIAVKRGRTIGAMRAVYQELVCPPRSISRRHDGTLAEVVRVGRELVEVELEVERFVMSVQPKARLL